MANELYHYGTKGHSGRYPPGSGENPKTGPRALLGKIRSKTRPSDKKIAKAVSSGDVKKVRKLKKYMTDEQLQTAVNRLRKREQLEKNLNSISPGDIAKGQKLMKAAISIGKQYGPALEKFAKNKIKEQQEAELNKILRSSDPSELAKAMKEKKLTNDQIKTAVDNIDLKRTVDDLSSAKNNKDIDKILGTYRSKFKKKK